MAVSFHWGIESLPVEGSQDYSYSKCHSLLVGCSSLPNIIKTCCCSAELVAVCSCQRPPKGHGHFWQALTAGEDLQRLQWCRGCQNKEIDGRLGHMHYLDTLHLCKYMPGGLDAILLH